MSTKRSTEQPPVRDQRTLQTWAWTLRKRGLGVKAGQWWQLAGLFLELAGLMTVAVGIRRARARYTEKDPWEQRAWDEVRRFLARFGRKQEKKIVVGAAVSVSGGGGMWARGFPGLGPWTDLDLEEKVRQLRDQVERQQKQVIDLHHRVDVEERARAATDEKHDRERVALETALGEAIADVAAGSLRLEIFGVSLFALGLGLGAFGIVLG